MENLKKHFKIFLRNLEFLIKKTLFKHPNKINNTFSNKFKFKISNFNTYIITIIVSLFIYLFYLTFPNIYEKTWLQNDIENKLLDKFKINFSISPRITYKILPSPHFSIKEVKVLNEDENNPKEIAYIRELKIFISQKNLFNKKKLKINKVLIKNANILVKKSNYIYYKKLFNNNFSEENIHIENSNIFFQNNAGETISIIQISKLNLFYDKIKLLNKFFLEGEVFKIPFTFELSKDLVNSNNNIVLVSKKLKLTFKNQENYNNEITYGLNNLLILNSKLISEYKINNNLLSFKSLKSNINNNVITYNGKLNFSPFDLTSSISLEQINLFKFLHKNSILLEIIKSRLLFNNNLSVNVSLDSKNVLDHKLLKNLKLNLNINNGIINFDKSQVLINKIGLLKISNSELNARGNKIMLTSDININIKDSDKFFSFFQTPKKNRKQITNISFSLDLDIINNQLNIGNMTINNQNFTVATKNILDLLNNVENKKTINLIAFKNFVNKILALYSG